MLNDMEETNNESIDGSESDPSADNVPVTKMLKNLKKFKDTKTLVIALKKEAIKKRKKDAIKVKKSEKNRLNQRLKQEEEAKKMLIIENTRIQNNIANDAATKKALDDQQKYKASKKKVTVFQSLPKFTPAYRLSQEERLTAPLPIKTVNFKDFDTSKYFSSVQILNTHMTNVHSNHFTNMNNNSSSSSSNRFNNATIHYASNNYHTISNNVMKISGTGLYVNNNTTVQDQSSSHYPSSPKAKLNLTNGITIPNNNLYTTNNNNSTSVTNFINNSINKQQQQRYFQQQQQLQQQQQQQQQKQPQQKNFLVIQQLLQLQQWKSQ
jgi:hypothetical protein